MTSFNLDSCCTQIGTCFAACDRDFTSCIDEFAECHLRTCFSLTSFDDQVVVFNINKNSDRYGVLTCTIKSSNKIEEWQQKILESFSDLVALSMSLKTKSDQDRRMALLSERTVIARELHDSLAQSLSYLKIQVTRLKRAIDADDKKNIVEEVSKFKIGA